MNEYEQASLILVTDHPFKPSHSGDVCGHRDFYGDWPCGYSRVEHADQGGGAIERP